MFVYFAGLVRVAWGVDKSKLGKAKPVVAGPSKYSEALYILDPDVLAEAGKFSKQIDKELQQRREGGSQGSPLPEAVGHETRSGSSPSALDSPQQ